MKKKEYDVHKLEDKVKDLIVRIESFPHDIVVNRHVDKFYYLQKLTELEIWEEKLLSAIRDVEWIVNTRQRIRNDVYLRWRGDVLWLSRSATPQNTSEQLQKMQCNTVTKKGENEKMIRFS